MFTKKIFLIIVSIIIWLSFFNISNAWVIDFESKWWDIKDVSMNVSLWNDFEGNVYDVWLSVLGTAKFLMEWLLIIYMVYVGMMMIMALWGQDEEKLTWAKKQLRYSLVAMLFINIPGTLYDAFRKDSSGTNITGWTSSTNFLSSENDSNLFVNEYIFETTVNNSIVWFLEVFIFGIAVFMIVLQWIRLMTARWREEKMSEAKNKLVYSILALIFVGVIEVWKNLAFTGNIQDWSDLFASLANLALFFAWPVGIFFLILAWYYYITANWDEDKVKKAKTIVINTVLATLILLASYTFLLDLGTLVFS